MSKRCEAEKVFKYLGHKPIEWSFCDRLRLLFIKEETVWEPPTGAGDAGCLIGFKQLGGRIQVTSWKYFT